MQVELVRLREARAADLRDARWEAESSSLSVLIDLRDRLHRVAGDAHTRLERGAAVVGAPPAAAADGFRAAAVAWLERLRSLLGSSTERLPAGDRDRNREILRAVVDGVALTLARLDEALERAGVREVPAVGLPFDSSRMLAVGFARVAGAVDGTVTDVEQAGYERDGRVLRPARVRVARTTTPMAAITERDQEQTTTERAGRTE
jgi:molecular chaperone GrpE